MKPYAHQLEFGARVCNPGQFTTHKVEPHYYAWWADPGCGKTIGTFLYLQSQPMKTLVLCPRNVMEDAWIGDAEHFPELRVHGLWHARADKKLDNLKADWDVGVLNFENFAKYADVIKSMGVERLVIDESARLKNYKAKVTKAIITASKHLKSVIPLCGEPAPNSPIEYLPQIMTLGPNAVFGNSWMLAAMRYFTPIRREYGERKVIVRWEPKPQRYGEFVDKLASVSWRVAKADCLDLPEVVHRTVHLEMEPKQRKAYEAQVDGIATLIGDDPGVIYNPAFQGGLTKLRQIANGYVYMRQAKAEVVDLSDAKIQAVMEQLDELPSREPVVIWIQFKHAVGLYRAALEQRGRSVGVLNGDTRKPGEVIRAFQTDETLDTLICHPKSVAHGITLTRAAYQFWPEHSHSYEEWSQGVARTDRAGQKRKQLVVKFVTKGTVDKVMQRAVESKQEFSEMVLEHIKRKGK